MPSTGGASRQHWGGVSALPLSGPCLVHRSCQSPWRHGFLSASLCFTKSSFFSQALPQDRQVGVAHPLYRLAPPTVPAPDALTHHAGQRRTAKQLRLSLSLSAQAAHVHRVSG